MNPICTTIREVFGDAAVMKNQGDNSLFTGRNLPSFVRDYVLRRFSNADGIVDSAALTAYLQDKMPDLTKISSRLMAGDVINLTTRFIVKNDLARNRIKFSIPDAQIVDGAYVMPSLAAEKREDPETADDFADGEKWGNITLRYIEPRGQGRGQQGGFIEMTECRLFDPYRNIDMDFYRWCRGQFNIEEWLDVLITAMEYEPDAFSSLEQKMEFISRLLILVEPRLNMIELGPRGTGKSYVYKNLSKHVWMISGGRVSRAQLFYNVANRQFGPLKYHDALIIDEISTFQFSDPDEMESIMKSYLEDGNATVSNVLFTSECGVALTGNITLDDNMQPFNDEYFRELPGIFNQAAVIDRISGFVEEWKLPRLSAGAILKGWTINAEYFSGVLHELRTSNAYAAIFDTLVERNPQHDRRDLKAFKKLAVAYCKLLLPHVTSLDALDEQQLAEYRTLFRVFCLEPAVYRRGIIRQQLHKIMPEEYPQLIDPPIQMANPDPAPAQVPTEPPAGDDDSPIQSIPQDTEN